MKCSTETHKNKKILTKITFSCIQGLLLIMLISVYKKYSESLLTSKFNGRKHLNSMLLM